jgi:hypothetical protein
MRERWIFCSFQKIEKGFNYISIIYRVNFKVVFLILLTMQMQRIYQVRQRM